ALLPRGRRPAAEARLGVDACGRQEGAHGRLLVADRPAGHVHHAPGALGEPAGRLAAGEVRPPAPPAVKLLEVRHLSTHYVSARGARVTRAVDDVSLTVGEGETLGIVRSEEHTSELQSLAYLVC